MKEFCRLWPTDPGNLFPRMSPGVPGPQAAVPVTSLVQWYWKKQLSFSSNNRKAGLSLSRHTNRMHGWEQMRRISILQR
jgi:hypothetical protein